MEEQIIDEMLRNDATPQIKGVMYQFLIALQYCFFLKEGQSLYVEHFGDVAILSDGSTNIGDAVEVKLYDEGNLTIRHHNFLNTIYNWMQDDFDINECQNLVLFTTQPLSKGTKEWYGLSVDDRYNTLKDSYSQYIDTHKDDKEPGATIKHNLEQMQYVLAREEKLHIVLGKLSLQDSQQDFDNVYEDLCDTYLAMITNRISKRMCISAFLGVIITSIVGGKYWYIRYEDFTRMKESLCDKYCTRKIMFPKISEVDVDDADFPQENFPFVEKLLDIEVGQEGLERCIQDFANVTELLRPDSEEPILSQDVKKFRADLKESYVMTRFEKEAMIPRDADVETVLGESRKFMWGLFRSAKQYIPFRPYEDVGQYVYNGMYHHMANESNDIIWRLK